MNTLEQSIMAGLTRMNGSDRHTIADICGLVKPQVEAYIKETIHAYMRERELLIRLVAQDLICKLTNKEIEGM
jgi:hypothetical protein